MEPTAGGDCKEMQRKRIYNSCQNDQMTWQELSVCGWVASEQAI